MIRTNSKPLGILLGLFLILLSVGGCERSESKAEPETNQAPSRAPKVLVQRVLPSPIRDILLLPGETEAWKDVQVSADSGGRVERIGPREGNPVKKDDLLAMIDVSALKAALDRAEAAYQLADNLYQRRKKLFDRKIINQEELDHSLTERTLALGSLRQVRVEHERGYIRSPIEGLVNNLYVEEGEFVDRGKPVVDLVNVDRIKINVNVPELDVRYIKVGQKAEVRVDAFPETRLLGTIDFVAYKADPATKTFRVRVLIENPGHRIRPGMIVRVRFLRRIIKDALTAPLFALVDKGGERFLFVEKDGIAHAREVTIGIIEGDRVQITDGLKTGDHLIVTGQTEVEEGMRVQVQ
ncbi:MAG: efflux RND transporter periplasmic adaptor subunit [Desulfatiglandaceae bacterium]